jgi:Uma2 family endonuclease
MSAVSTPARTRISVERYQKMVAAGVLTKQDRIELIEGEMIDMAPIGSKHAAIAARLTQMLVMSVGESAIVSPGGPVNLGNYSEPQPDLLLLKYQSDFHENSLPVATDVLLVIEISDSTLAFDQTTKLNLYARYGVQEYWIVDVAANRVIAFRDPTPHGYGCKLELQASDAISPNALPNVALKIGKLFR